MKRVVVTGFCLCCCLTVVVTIPAHWRRSQRIKHDAFAAAADAWFAATATLAQRRVFLAHIAAQVTSYSLDLQQTDIGFPKWHHHTSLRRVPKLEMTTSTTHRMSDEGHHHLCTELRT